MILLRPKQTGAADSLNEFGSSKGLAAARGWGAAGRGRGLRSSRTRAALLTTCHEKRTRPLVSRSLPTRVGYRLEPRPLRERGFDFFGRSRSACRFSHSAISRFHSAHASIQSNQSPQPGQAGKGSAGLLTLPTGALGAFRSTLTATTLILARYSAGGFLRDFLRTTRLRPSF